MTGFSDVMGRELAVQLGQAGLNVLIVAWNKAALGKLAEEITTLYLSRGLIDFGKAAEDDLARLEEVVRRIDIGILVKDVGRSHSIPSAFTETPMSEINDIITINVKRTLRITHLVVPRMIGSSRNHSRKNLVIKVGSLSGAILIALLSTYSASKSFLATWLAALREELKPNKIDVIVLNAFYIMRPPFFFFSFTGV
uniref:Short-chain dehydrogenase reductase sdr n=1 Tax=Moniliophthora roreri TaxID=221103 RepID=A0A0W0FD18_MONRR